MYHNSGRFDDKILKFQAKLSKLRVRKSPFRAQFIHKKMFYGFDHLNRSLKNSLLLRIHFLFVGGTFEVYGEDLRFITT